MKGLAESAKVQLEKFSNKFKKTMNDSIDAKFLREVGEEVKRLIYTRTKLGYGVKKNYSQKEKLKQLSPYYIEIRKIAKKEGLLHKTTTAKKSNLTFSGQLLDSLKVVKTERNKTFVGPSGYRDDGLTNEQVANQVSKTRPFMFLSDLEVQKVQRFTQNNFNSVFKQRFK